MNWLDVQCEMPRIREHDPDTWEAFSKLIYPFLRTCALQVAGNGWAEASSSDIVQECWVKLRASIDGFQGATTPADTAACLRSWLRSIVRTVTADRIRRNNRLPIHRFTEHNELPEAVATDPTPSTQAVRMEWQTRLEAVLARLGPDERQIIRRSLYEGASCRQIASELGVTDHTVVGDWRKEILAQLRRSLGEDS